MTSNHIIQNNIARKFILFNQELFFENGREKPTEEKILAIVKKIGCIQLDTINVVHRSHYLTLWSRIGSFDVNDFNNLVYNSDKECRKLFEYWFHCASIIPFELYKYRASKREAFKLENTFYKEFFSDEKAKDTLNEIRNYVVNHGSVSSKNFDDKKPQGGWWNWKISKKALELLYCQGELMVDSRKGFNKVYDLKERILPSWVDKSELSIEDENSFILELSCKSQGLCSFNEVSDYSFSNHVSSKSVLNKLLDEGVLRMVKVELINGKLENMLCHRDNFSILNSQFILDNKPSKTTFLNPFDNFFWAKSRSPKLWNFDQKLEAYKPAEKRKYGYYSMPILSQGNFIGRIEPSFDKKNSMMNLLNLHVDKSDNWNDLDYRRTFIAFIDFANFHSASDLSFPKVQRKYVDEVVMEQIENSNLKLHFY